MRLKGVDLSGNTDKWVLAWFTSPLLQGARLPGCSDLGIYDVGSEGCDGLNLNRWGCLTSNDDPLMFSEQSGPNSQYPCNETMGNYFCLQIILYTHFRLMSTSVILHIY